MIETTIVPSGASGEALFLTGFLLVSTLGTEMYFRSTGLPAASTGLLNTIKY